MISAGWHKPFVAFLEPLQGQWNRADAEERQQLLWETKTGLQDWAALESVDGQLPNSENIKVVSYLMHIFIARQLISLSYSI